MPSGIVQGIRDDTLRKWIRVAEANRLLRFSWTKRQRASFPRYHEVSSSVVAKLTAILVQKLLNSQPTDVCMFILCILFYSANSDSPAAEWGIVLAQEDRGRQSLCSGGLKKPYFIVLLIIIMMWPCVSEDTD